MVVLQVRVAVVAELLPDQPRLSIIVPVLNEADCLDQNLAKLFALPRVNSHCEVIVSDGGSTDRSLEIAQSYPCRIVHCNAGRATQMNTAWRQANGRFLLFLHADSSLPVNFYDAFETDAEWGFFRLRLDNRALIYRIIESAINLRTRWSRVAGGDQGLFFKRTFFDSINAYPPIPLMEDVAICKIARRYNRPAIIASAITGSSRRWQQQGVIKTVLLMWLLRLAYWLGVNPERLQKIYYPQRG